MEAFLRRLHEESGDKHCKKNERGPNDVPIVEILSFQGQDVHWLLRLAPNCGWDCVCVCLELLLNLRS